MSEAIPDKVAIVAVKEPSIDLAQPKYGVLLGPQTVGWQQYPASSVSAGSISISANQPDRKTLISRRCYLQLNASFTFTGQCPGGGIPLLNLGMSDGFRAFPITSVVNAMTMKLAGKAVSLGQMNQLWAFLLRYHNEVLSRDRNYSITPAMLDQYQEYAQGLAQNNNPLAGYGSNPAEMSRGGWTQSQIFNLVNPAPGGAGIATASFDVVLQEPLLLSPFLFARGDQETDLIGLDNFNFQATFDPLARMWSRFNIAGGSTIDPANPAHSIIVNLTGAQLLFRQSTPQPTTMIPRELNFSYYNPVIFQQSGATLIAPGASTTLVSSVITLPGIPRRVYIWASEVQQNLTYLSSDTAFSLQNLTFKWGTHVFLREATALDLYNIAVKNGVCLSWPQWTTFVGSVLCLEMGSDIGLSPTESAGSDGKYQLQITAQVTNENPSRSVLPNLNIVAVQEGLIQIRDGTVYINENPVSGEDVLRAKAGSEGLYKRSESVYGGGIVAGGGFKDFARAVKKTVKVVRKGVEYGKKGLELARRAAPIAREGLALARLASGGAPPLRRPVRGRAAIRAAMRGRGFAEEEEEYEDVVEEDEDAAGGAYDDEEEAEEEEEEDAVSAFHR